MFIQLLEMRHNCIERMRKGKEVEKNKFYYQQIMPKVEKLRNRMSILLRNTKVNYQKKSQKDKSHCLQGTELQNREMWWKTTGFPISCYSTITLKLAAHVHTCTDTQKQGRRAGKFRLLIYIGLTEPIFFYTLSSKPLK